MALESAIRDALDHVLSDEPQRDEVKTQLKQLVANWFDGNASDDDVARIVKLVSVHKEEEE